MLYERFGLILDVTHQCNMACSYCYAGHASAAAMPEAVGRSSIDRALASIERGGMLELGFFGGEPLLEAERIFRLMGYAMEKAVLDGIRIAAHLTTNGTIREGRAWAVLTHPLIDVHVSCDGLPEVHDRHRRFRGGAGGSSGSVLRTISELLNCGKNVGAMMVVRPDTVDALPTNIRFLADIGLRRIQPALDVWAHWTPRDMEALVRAIAESAHVWRQCLPDLSIGWFDEKAALLAGLGRAPTARCGFGAGEVAVAPSGRLYPCERLIGGDDGRHPLRLGGTATAGRDFLSMRPPEGDACSACEACAANHLCSATCRCSNYVRTGNTRTPDRLLCTLDRACLTATARALGDRCISISPVPHRDHVSTVPREDQEERRHETRPDPERRRERPAACSPHPTIPGAPWQDVRGGRRRGGRVHAGGGDASPHVRSAAVNAA